MAYVRMRGDTTLSGLGCGPGCSCAPCRRSQLSGFGERYIRDEDFFRSQVPPEQEAPEQEAMAPGPPGVMPPPGTMPPTANIPPPPGREVTVSPSSSAQLGDFGWTVKFLGAPPSHEEITKRAIGPASKIEFRVGGVPRSSTLTSREIDEIIEGNRSVDLGFKGTGVLFALAKGEQKRHALRREFGQPQMDAWRDIVAYIRSEHSKILAETDHTKRLRRIGQILHSIQDSFSPAHTCRRPSSGSCIAWVRNFGRGGFSSSGIEHQVPKDPRDEMANSPGAATEAQTASREYLQIVFKAIYGKSSAPDAATAQSEAAREFAAFVVRRFRQCVEAEGHRHCAVSPKHVPAPAPGAAPMIPPPPRVPPSGRQGAMFASRGRALRAPGSMPPSRPMRRGV